MQAVVQRLGGGVLEQARGGRDAAGAADEGARHAAKARSHADTARQLDHALHTRCERSLGGQAKVERAGRGIGRRDGQAGDEGEVNHEKRDDGEKERGHHRPKGPEIRVRRCLTASFDTFQTFAADPEPVPAR